jgi:hypothetical protein
MVYIWLVIGSWAYAVLAALCFRRLSQRFLHWGKGWLIAASIAWPVWILLWALHHSIAKTVDWIEKVLNIGFPMPKNRPNRNLDVKDIPD